MANRDPHWITLKYPGKCAKPGCGASLPKGTRAFRYSSGSLYGQACGHGETASAEFAAAAQDEAFVNGGY